MLALGLPEASSRAFWADQFGAKSEVPWSEFEKALGRQFRTASKQAIACMKLLLLGTEQGADPAVGMPMLGRVVCWFGPLSDWHSQTLLERVVSVMREPWFHGFASKDETAARLNGALASLPGSECDR